MNIQVKLETMQIQIEHTNSNSSCCENYQLCYLCQQHFERKEASVILCDDQGNNCGEACTHCIAKGYSWMHNQFQQLNYQINLSVNRESNELIKV
ncbi:hypothetical protein IQ230_00190 [Gloeocapsopsis crepidinum LEGE 06123]|uniref:Uncharacterized protein n=1 Tax=Gloeocapsopsis crepidinum LEGE 06123 TaxID=588587 RepID=A0ABR9UKK0_9CHRO|nr:hypothetical protein [Gloeocapsopsis crepidinum]MBE9188807.1 hypothetical protein [Gloeocapsopsis crepidinum LEGE 06123]